MAHSARCFTILIGLCFFFAPATGVVADELFICDGNKNVRVPLDKLEHMKRTNACVAAHYGIEIKEKIEPVAKADQAPPKLVSGPVRVIKKTVRAEPKKKKSATQHITRRTVPAKSALKSNEPAKIYKAGEALPVEDVAAKPSDHRNVKVLNAKSKPNKWFKHIY